MRIFETADYNIIQNRKIAYVISGILIALSIGVIVTKGLQYGIDFRGGTEIVISFDQAPSVGDVRAQLTEPLGGVPEVKLFGNETDLLIRTDAPGNINNLQEIITNSVKELYPDYETTIIKTDVVGPRFAEDLKEGALYAIITSIIVIFIYILIRFRKWTFSAGAVAALLHDITITLGIFTLLSNLMPFNMTIDQNIIAAFLTIVGYSLNDTVVVFDRIRENSLIYKTMDREKMVNKSINNTLSRTVVTSGTTLFVVVVLFILGGEVLRGLSFALIIGVVIGTYSSIFVASSIATDLENALENKSA
jgi:preprotein translocase SecF subunit